MRVIRSNYAKGINVSRDDEGRSSITTDFFFQAVENADGVPFHLIFGPGTGEGRYQYIGSGIRKLLGVAPGDFTEKIFLDMTEEVIPLSPDIPADPGEVRRKFMSGDLKSYKAEILVRKPGGEKSWIRDASLPFTDKETGKVIGAFGILYNVTHTGIPQNESRATIERLAEVDRLKMAFLNNLSHEIRTPLNAIVGFSTLLSDPQCDDVQKQGFREIITKSSDHLLSLINDIVELSKIEAGIGTTAKRRISLNNMISTIFNQFMSSAYEQKITFGFRTAYGDEESYFLTDATKLTHVLRQLVENALKFTEKGAVEFGYEEREGIIEFFVKDTGIGIPENIQPEVFTKFYKADNTNSRNYDGTGIGLTLAKAFVELMGGTIWFSSQPGKGTEFRFSVELERDLLA